MNRFVLIFAVASLLAGCASKLGQIQTKNWSKIQVGMTREEVIKNLGPPRTTSAHHNVEILDYVEDRGVLITRGTGIFKHYYIQLTDGKVDGYGPEDTVTPVAAPQGVPNVHRPDVERVRKKYASYSTDELQLRRQQVAEAIPDMVFKFGLFGPDYTKERHEKEEIEMELLRRFQEGDAAAEVKPLPQKSSTTVRGGNF